MSNKLSQEEYEKLVKLLSQRKENREKEIPLDTVVEALKELELLQELDKNDIRNIQGKASKDIQKNQGKTRLQKAKLLIAIFLFGGVVYIGTQIFPELTRNIWQKSISTITGRPDSVSTNQNTVTNSNDQSRSNPLKPGQSISNQGFSVTVKNPSFADLPGEEYIATFEITFANHSGGELVTQIDSENLSIVASNGKSYSKIDFWHYKDSYNEFEYNGSLEDFEIYSFAAGQKERFKLAIEGDMSENVNEIIVKIKDAGRIKKGSWSIKVPR